MSLFLRVPLRRAEAVRKRIRSLGAYDAGRRVEGDKKFVYFPVTESVKVAGASMVQRPGTKQKRRARSLAEALSCVLSKKELSCVPSSFDVVGDVAVLEFPKGFGAAAKREVAKTLLSLFLSIKVVVEKSAKVSGTYRVRGVRHLAGEKRTETVHTEYGCRYLVDVARDYFSPRLGTERMRVASQVADCEEVLVLFAGVGPYAIMVAKKKRPARVVAVELNPHAADAMRKNVELNKTEVEVVLGDAKTEAKKHGKFDRIIMPLPKEAGDFLAPALSALKKNGVVHFYLFARDKKEAAESLGQKLKKIGKKPEIISVVECGTYSPRVSRYCVDFKLAG